jgi:hypothetical protein
MSLIKREPSPEQSIASQANGRRSNGPRSARGKAISSRNSLKLRRFSAIVARSMAALGERPADFEQIHKALAAAMEPRDGWESAWVQDIAILRWRLGHLHRAEVGVVALRRRRLKNQRRRASAPPTGSAALQLNSLVALCGFTGLPDSAMKFQQVIPLFTQLRDIVRAERFEKDSDMYFSLLYAKAMGPNAALLKSHFDSVAKQYQEGDPDGAVEARQSLLAELNKEISDWEQLQALYAAEHLEADPLQEDANLLLPDQELEGVIRYETHLEDQIERKLRQFYARRREPVLRRAESLPAAVDEKVAVELACRTASAGSQS